MQHSKSDFIIIGPMECLSIIGTLPHERTTPQPIRMTLTLFADLSLAGKSDCLTDTVDYSRIEREIFAMTKASSFQLIEALAETIATHCLNDNKIMAVRVRIEKPNALKLAKLVAIEIERHKTKQTNEG